MIKPPQKLSVLEYQQALLAQIEEKKARKKYEKDQEELFDRAMNEGPVKSSTQSSKYKPLLSDLNDIQNAHCETSLLPSEQCYTEESAACIDHRAHLSASVPLKFSQSPQLNNIEFEAVINNEQPSTHVNKPPVMCNASTMTTNSLDGIFEHAIVSLPAGPKSDSVFRQSWVDCESIDKTSTEDTMSQSAGKGSHQSEETLPSTPTPTVSVPQNKSSKSKRTSFYDEYRAEVLRDAPRSSDSRNEISCKGFFSQVMEMLSWSPGMSETIEENITSIGGREGGPDYFQGNGSSEEGITRDENMHDGRAEEQFIIRDGVQIEGKDDNTVTCEGEDDNTVTCDGEQVDTEEPEEWEHLSLSRVGAGAGAASVGRSYAVGMPSTPKPTWIGKADAMAAVAVQKEKHGPIGVTSSPTYPRDPPQSKISNVENSGSFPDTRGVKDQRSESDYSSGVGSGGIAGMFSSVLAVLTSPTNHSVSNTVEHEYGAVKAATENRRMSTGQSSDRIAEFSSGRIGGQCSDVETEVDGDAERFNPEFGSLGPQRASDPARLRFRMFADSPEIRGTASIRADKNRATDVDMGMGTGMGIITSLGMDSGDGGGMAHRRGSMFDTETETDTDWDDRTSDRSVTAPRESKGVGLGGGDPIEMTPEAKREERRQRRSMRRMRHEMDDMSDISTPSSKGLGIEEVLTWLT